MSERVQVLVRVRPFLPTEEDHTNAVDVVSSSKVKVKDRVFSVDHVYPGPTTTSTIYREHITSMVDSFLQGYNSTAMAYGQTGSGKTHTIAGMIPLLIDSLDQLGGGIHGFQFQYVEVYGDVLRDLFAPDPSATAGALKLSEEASPDGASARVVISGARVVRVTQVKDALRLLVAGAERRATAFTRMNEDSSRSHSILIVECIRHHAKFHLVDLAGSERNKKTQNTGVRLMESIAINTGLLTLGNVIRALYRNSVNPDVKNHVPYRNSKLTRLLQDSLGGDCRTLFIACVAPNHYNRDETLRTLQYCALAQHIVNEAHPHTTPTTVVAQGQFTDANLYEEICSYCIAQEEALQTCQHDLNVAVDRLAACEAELQKDATVFQTHIREIQHWISYSSSLEERVNELEEELKESRKSESRTGGELTLQSSDREAQLFRLTKETLFYQTQNAELKNKLSAAVALLDSQRRESALLRVEINNIHELLRKH